MLSNGKRSQVSVIPVCLSRGGRLRLLHYPLLCWVLWSHALNQTIVIFQLISLTCPQEQPALVLHSVQHSVISPCGPKAKKNPEHSSPLPQLSHTLVSPACCYIRPLIQACFLLQIMANLSVQGASQTFSVNFSVGRWGILKTPKTVSLLGSTQGL